MSTQGQLSHLLKLSEAITNKNLLNNNHQCFPITLCGRGKMTNFSFSKVKRKKQQGNSISTSRAKQKPFLDRTLCPKDGQAPL